MSRTIESRTELSGHMIRKAREALSELSASGVAWSAARLGERTVNYNVVISPYLRVIKPDLSLEGLAQLFANPAALAQGLIDWHNWMVYSLLDDKEGLGVPVTVELLYQQVLFDLFNKNRTERVRSSRKMEVEEAMKAFERVIASRKSVKNPLGIPISKELCALMEATPETVTLVEMGRMMELRMAALREQILRRKEQISAATSLPGVLEKRSADDRNILATLVLFDTYVRDRTVSYSEWGDRQESYFDKQTNSRVVNMRTAAQLLDRLVKYGCAFPGARIAKGLVLRGEHPFVVEKTAMEQEFVQLRLAFDLFCVSGPLRILEIAMRGNGADFDEVVRKIGEEVTDFVEAGKYSIQLLVKGS